MNHKLGLILKELLKVIPKIYQETKEILFVMPCIVMKKNLMLLVSGSNSYHRSVRNLMLKPG